MNRILNVRLAQKREDGSYHRAIPYLTMASKQGFIVLVFNTLVLKHLLLCFSHLQCFFWCFRAFKMQPATLVLIILHLNFCQCDCIAKLLGSHWPVLCLVSKEWLTWLLHTNNSVDHICRTSPIHQKAITPSFQQLQSDPLGWQFQEEVTQGMFDQQIPNSDSRVTSSSVKEISSNFSSGQWWLG